jgi:Alginate lyase
MLYIAWTTCPYVVRDGRVNPDVQTLNGPGAINGLSQALIYNAIAYSFSNSTTYSRNFVQFIDAFFLDKSTSMYPNMNYGQIVRGPGPDGSSGTWTGILDLRGLVKVVNGVLIMKGMHSPDWTSARDQLMNDWISQYAKWLTGSKLGKETASRPKYVTIWQSV